MNLVKSKSRSRPTRWELLRHWRDTRGRSQIELSLDAGISQRHLAHRDRRVFPAARLLIGIAAALDIPLLSSARTVTRRRLRSIYAETGMGCRAMRSVTVP